MLRIATILLRMLVTDFKAQPTPHTSPGLRLKHIISPMCPNVSHLNEGSLAQTVGARLEASNTYIQNAMREQE